MEISTQQDSEEVVRGIGQNFRFWCPVLCQLSNECCRNALHDTIQRSWSSVPTLQLARNEQNQIKHQKMKDVDSWIAV
ncbi:MAG: hypothetical protein ACYTXI_38155 [Nostoc sp.]